MSEASKLLFAETERETNAFVNTYKQWKIASIILVVVFILFIFALRVFLLGDILSYVFYSQLSTFFTFAMIAACIATLGWFNPRLNQKGALLKEEWLGFKMYLETAERYRMQNLTPDMFEKYLPYAMIFGIEKKWAKAFGE